MAKSRRARATGGAGGKSAAALAGADLRIELVPVESLVPYARNSRTHSDVQVAQIAASIREFGWTNPVLIDAERGVIAGHGRLLAARKLGLERVPVIELAHLTDEQRRAYIIADNRLAELAGWDDELLALELRELKERGFDIELTGFDDADLRGMEDAQNVYTARMEAPVYVPTGDCPPVSALVDLERADALLTEIDAAEGVPEEVRDFLRQAAMRHFVFDYRAIAEFYAHAEPAVQRLMEASALVIIDFDQAIERGYVQLSKRLEDIYHDTEDDDGEGGDAA